jgi:coenzyme PQQ precursor peptide PqqA
LQILQFQRAEKAELAKSQCAVQIQDTQKIETKSASPIAFSILRYNLNRTYAFMQRKVRTAHPTSRASAPVPLKLPQHKQRSERDCSFWRNFMDTQNPSQTSQQNSAIEPTESRQPIRTSEDWEKPEIEEFDLCLEVTAYVYNWQ